MMMAVVGGDIFGCYGGYGDDGEVLWESWLLMVVMVVAVWWFLSDDINGDGDNGED